MIPRGGQRPEQHGGSVRRWQKGLRLDPSLNSSFSRSMALVAAHVHNGDAGNRRALLKIFRQPPEIPRRLSSNSHREMPPG
jgi:hypothetical protein